MHLPGPLRAAVGLAATAATEAKHLPDRAIELPMLVVSSALQASLRAQQRYARYAARGDEVLNRRTPTAEPPSWATFDEPVPLDELRRAADRSGAGGPLDGRSSLESLFGVEDPTVPPDGREPVGEILPADEPAPDVVRPATTTAPARTKASVRKAAKNASADKTSATKTPKKKTSTRKTAAKKTSAGKTPSTTPAAASAPQAAAVDEGALAGSADDPAIERGKTVSKPRHTEPSAFDNVGDD